MRTPEQMEALATGKIDVAFARPLEPPFDRTLRAELLYRDPVVVVLPRNHPLAGKPISIAALAAERFVLCDRQMTPALFDGILALCSAAGFSPNIVNTPEPGPASSPSSNPAKASAWFPPACAICGPPESSSLRSFRSTSTWASRSPGTRKIEGPDPPGLPPSRPREQRPHPAHKRQLSSILIAKKTPSTIARRGCILHFSFTGWLRRRW